MWKKGDDLGKFHGDGEISLSLIPCLYAPFADEILLYER